MKKKEKNGENYIILEPDKIKFEMGESGVLRMITDGKTYKRVYPLSVFPITNPDNFISIRDVEEDEIGLIKNLKDLSHDQQNLIRSQLRISYFVPTIKEIYKIKEEFGIYAWHVKTSRGQRTFYVKGRNENLVLRGNSRLLITDIEECRYEIEDFNKLPRRSLAELDKVL